MLNLSLLLVTLLTFIQALYPQSVSTGRYSNTRFSFQLGGQNQRDFVKDPSNHYQLGSFAGSMLLPVYRKQTLGNSPRISGLFLSPSLELSKADISYIQQSRMLVNAGLGIGGYYLIHPKHFLLGTFRGLVNEDEFTIDYYQLRYNAALLYSWRMGSKFTLLSGLAYTYTFGEGLFLPMLGGRYLFGPKHFIQVVLPLQISYTRPFGNRIVLSAYIRPSGGFNRFENRRYFADSTVNVMALRRRAISTGIQLTYQLKNSLRLYTSLALLGGQRITFTEDGERNGDIYFKGNVENALQLRVGLVWYPFLNNLRNENKEPLDNDDTDDDFLLGL